MQEPSPEDEFAARVRQAREARHLSQAQLAELLRVHHGIRLDPTAITRLERGNRLIRLNEAVALADVLSIRLFDLTRRPFFRGLSPGAIREEAPRLIAELEALDAEIARADQTSMASRVEASDLREQRQDVQGKLAELIRQPGLSREEALAYAERGGIGLWDPDPGWFKEQDDGA